jgi:hypothetical protein
MGDRLNWLLDARLMRSLPWVFLFLALPFGLLAGALVETDACEPLFYARGVGHIETFEPDDHIAYLWSECRIAYTGGTVAENSNFNWMGVLLVATFSAGAWFTGAAIGRVVPWRRAALVVFVCLVVFAATTTAAFTGA